MRTIPLFLAPLLLAPLLLFSSCGRSAGDQTADEPTPAPTAEEASAPARDRTSRYLLSAYGEAIIDDAGTPQTLAADDNSRVFYEIFVGSFADSDGDGTGDLRGIIERFDYLNDGDPASGLSLGVGGIWLTPIFLSPSYHKYDVTDYYEIDPAFGTEDDLRELIELCRDRNVKLILDLPINHTGEKDEWFTAFREARVREDPDDPYYDFYVCCESGEEPPGRTFAPLRGTELMYECNFSTSMPELNYDCEAVRQAVLDIAKYYLDLGVDGFRFDAAKYLYFGDNDACVDFWTWYVGELRAIKPDVYTVAEVWDSDGVTDVYFPAVNCFDFTTSQVGGLIAETAKYGNVNALTSYIETYIENIRSLRDDAMPVLFITNHDQDRAAGFLTVASSQMQMAANLYILSPGSPFIYYGEELGVRGSRGAAATDANRRLPLPWGDDYTAEDPVGATYDADKRLDTTAADQAADGGSLYSYYKRLLMIRAANPEIACGGGEYKALALTDTKAGGFTATYEGQTVCVVHNTTQHDMTVDLDGAADAVFSEVTAVIGAGTAELSGTILTIGAQTSAVLR